MSGASQPTTEGINALLGREAAQAGDAARGAFAVDGVQPGVVAYPESAEEVAALLQQASRDGWAVLPWGGGSGMGRGAPPARYDLALSLSRLAQVVDHDQENLTVTGEGGLRVGELNRRLATKHQVLNLTHADAANTLGGIIAANPIAPKRLLYGDVRDQMLGLRVALPGGRLVRYGRKVLKNVAGYDMNKLFLGSQGMLGVVVEATFKLSARPDEERCLVAAFSDAQVAVAAAAELYASQLIPAALLLRSTGDGDAYALLAAFEGRSQALKRQMDETAALVQRHGAWGTETLDGIPHAWREPATPAHHGEDSPPPLRLRLGLPPATLGRWIGKHHPLPEMLADHMDGIVDYGAGQWTVQAPGMRLEEGGETMIAALATHLARLRSELDALGGFLVLEAAPPEIKRRIPIFGARPGEESLMRLLQARFDPAGIMAPGRYFPAANAAPPPHSPSRS